MCAALQVANFEVTRLTARLAQLERDLEAATSRSVADVLTAKQDVEDRLRSLDADKRAAYVVWGVGLGWDWGGGGGGMPL